MQIAAGSWILDATPAVPVRPVGRNRDDAQSAERPRPRNWAPLPAQGRGLLIDIVV